MKNSFFRRLNAAIILTFATLQAIAGEKENTGEKILPPEPPLPQYNACAELARSATYFIALGEKRAVEELKRVAVLPNVAEEPNRFCRRFSHVCRILFTAKPGHVMRRALQGPNGEPFDRAAQTNPTAWPYYPLAESDGVFFVLSGGGFGFSGVPESNKSYLEYCLKNGQFRTTPVKVPTEAEARAALDKLVAGDAWRNLPWRGTSRLPPKSKEELDALGLTRQTRTRNPSVAGDLSDFLRLELSYHTDRFNKRYFTIKLVNTAPDNHAICTDSKNFHGDFEITFPGKSPVTFREKNYERMLGIGKPAASPIQTVKSQDAITWKIFIEDLTGSDEKRTGIAVTEPELIGASVKVKLNSVAVVGVPFGSKGFIASNAKQETREYLLPECR